MPTEIVKYVDPDGGILADYTSLQAAINAEKAIRPNLVARDEVLKLLCISSAGTPDMEVVVVSGFTTDETRKIVIQGDNNTGIWDETKYRIVSTATLTGVIFLNNSNLYIDLQNMQIHTDHSSSYLHGVWVQSAKNVTISSCVFKGSANSNLYNDGVFKNSGALITIKNSVFTGFRNGSGESNAIRSNHATQTIFSLSNTIYDCKVGHRIMFGTITAKNCNYQSNGIGSADGYQSSVDGDYNISDIAGDAPGANSLNETTVNFSDASAGDFRLLPESPGIDQGVDLSADASYPFNTDIIGTLRPQGAAWDIGAFELIQQTFNPAWARQANKIIRAI